MSRLLIILSLFTSAVFASEKIQTNDSMKGYYVGSCNHWMLMHSEYGYAWGCSTQPAVVVVPDGYDVGEQLTDAHTKIADLEKRIEALEKSCKK